MEIAVESIVNTGFPHGSGWWWVAQLPPWKEANVVFCGFEEAELGGTDGWCRYLLRSMSPLLKAL